MAVKQVIEHRAIESLKPYHNNARVHSERQIDQLAKSIKEWGWTIPILIDEDDEIIAGHGRLTAARQLGISDVPVMVARGWTKAQKQAYVIADNQLTLNATWDHDLLAKELKELKSIEFDIELIGFDAKNIADLLGETDNDKTSGDVGISPTIIQVVVECRSMTEQEKIYERLTSEGYSCKLLSM